MDIYRAQFAAVIKVGWAAAYELRALPRPRSHLGGIAPDLRMFDGDCAGMKDPAQKDACFQEMDDYFTATVRRGRVRDGRVYMPPFEGTLTQEAIWAIRSYIEVRREP